MGIMVFENEDFLRFSYHKSIGAIMCYGNQRYNPIRPKNLRQPFPYLMMLYMLFYQNWPMAFRDALLWKCFVCLFDLILYVPSTIFQLKRDRASWVEPVLSWDKFVLLKDHNAVTLVRIEPTAPQSRVEHSTTESLRSLLWKCGRNTDHCNSNTLLEPLKFGSDGLKMS